MEIAFYKGYVTELKSRIDALRQSRDGFQVYDLHMELVASKVQIGYALSRHKGVNDSLFYRNDTATGQRSQLGDNGAFTMFERFFSLGQFVAVAGKASELDESDYTKLLTSGWSYPVCAIGFSYRKKGAASTVSTKMLFIGLNDDDDAMQYVQKLDQPGFIVGRRPFATAQLWEWK